VIAFIGDVSADIFRRDEAFGANAEAKYFSHVINIISLSRRRV